MATNQELLTVVGGTIGKLMTFNFRLLEVLITKGMITPLEANVLFGIATEDSDLRKKADDFFKNAEQARLSLAPPTTP